MANGIVIHIAAGEEKRTEFFGGERIKIGTDPNCDLRFEPPEDHALAHDPAGVWLELRRENGSYRVADFKENFNFELNNAPLVLLTKLREGDLIKIPDAELTLQFFNVGKQSALTATSAGAEGAHSMRFIEEAALESAISSKRDDAKVFLREFVRELVNEVGWMTKLVVLLVVIAALSGLFYVGMAVSNELQRTGEITRQQGQIIADLKDELAKNRAQLGNLDKTNQQLIDIVTMAPTLRNKYGNGVCLLVGTYDLVDKQTGKQLRYPDPTMMPTPDPFEPAPPSVSENGFAPAARETAKEQQSPLTTEGSGTPVEYDFVGTGFHVGGGYILTNRHVVQPWTESEEVKVMSRLANGRARLKKLVVYFPGFPQPFPLKVRETAANEDLAVASLDPNSVFPEIPILPLDDDSDAARVGKTVVTMGYPSGPDRLVAMADEKDARRIQSRCNGSLQILVGCLAQEKLITPLLTQGNVTDLRDRRIVHNAQTAEGGSGAPLFGQSGRVIGVNFGVFTENSASNMAIPIKFVLPLLRRSGWISPQEAQQQPAETEKADSKNNSNVNTNSNTAKPPRS
ncbi:MAG: trypsin-like peptidase domain-containing protein [Pyrinomonadaceae bacterium]